MSRASERERFLQEMVDRVVKGVRFDVRFELIAAGLVTEPLHWSPDEAAQLAAHLRTVAARLDGEVADAYGDE